MNKTAAKTILELDKKFSVMYGKTAQMAMSARSQSHHINDRVDKKILNIMQKLKNRFDPTVHKAKNEELILRMRHKAAI